MARGKQAIARCFTLNYQYLKAYHSIADIPYKYKKKTTRESAAREHNYHFFTPNTKSGTRPENGKGDKVTDGACPREPLNHQSTPAPSNRGYTGVW